MQLLSFAFLYIISACVDASAVLEKRGASAVLGKRDASAVLEKRINFFFTGFNEQQRRRIDQDFATIRLMARGVHDNVGPDHSTFQRIFGSDRHYVDIMGVFDRITGIDEISTGLTMSISVVFMNEEGAQAYNGGTASNVLAQYSLGEETGNQRIEIFSNYFELPSIWEEGSSPDNVDLIRRGLNTRQSCLFHELSHWAGDFRIWGPILNQAFPSEIITFENRDVVLLNTVHDVRLGNAADDGDYWFIQESGLDPGATAYWQENVLALPQLRFGYAYAALNADSYAALASAVHMGWHPHVSPPVRRIPQHWDFLDIRDPLRNEYLPDALEVIGLAFWIISRRGDYNPKPGT